MKLSFGICTAYEDIMRLNAVIDSIRALDIPTYEIIIAGSYPTRLDVLPTVHGAKHLLTDGWVTKKKNMIASAAEYENLVLLHDYFLFDSLWYKEWDLFDQLTAWDVATNPQFLITGKRHFTDWVTWDDPQYGRYFPLPHDEWTHTKYQYVSGGYMLVRRDFLRANQFNEEMKPGQPEDVEWSLRIRDKSIMVCNPSAIVRHNKVHRDAR